jgi:hypothetical protein
MQWTMPPRVLQIVASLLALAAAASFVTGILNAPQRGRLPGERATGSAAASTTVIDATDATPLSNERIEGPPPPSANEEADTDEKTTEADAGNSDEQTSAAATTTPPTTAANAPPILPIPPMPGNAAPAQTLGGPPAPDEPPH